MGFLRNITTGKDNQTHDIVRVAMTGIIASLLVTLMLGVASYVFGYFYSIAHPEIKLFDIQTFFTATSTYALGVAAFLMGGAASLFFKKTTEPDGTQTTVENITKGLQPETHIDQTTIITPP